MTVGVDVFKADDGDVVDALNDVHGNVRTQLREVETARSRFAAARDEEAKAVQSVAATQKRIDDLTAQSDGVVADAFMNPPADTALDAMAAESTGDASLKASIVGMQHDADASILARLQEAHEDLDAHREAQDEAAQRAAATADQAAAALEDLEAAQSQEAAFVLEVESRLDQNLAEAEALASAGPPRSGRRRRLPPSRARWARPPAACRTWPSRSPSAEPTAARPTTPSTRRRRPRARRPRPGPARRCTRRAWPSTSLCGGGGTISRGSACFGWLDGHAAGHGLHNLPSEPWHWSTDGS